MRERDVHAVAAGRLGLGAARNLAAVAGVASVAGVWLHYRHVMVDPLTGEHLPGELDARTDAPIAHDLPNGMIFDMTAEQYIRDWALPQAAFHQMTAYAILRQAGVVAGRQEGTTRFNSLRRNDLDVRGHLSEEALAACTDFFLKTCLDQVTCVEGLMQSDRLRAHPSVG